MDIHHSRLVPYRSWCCRDPLTVKGQAIPSDELVLGRKVSCGEEEYTSLPTVCVRVCMWVCMCAGMYLVCISWSVCEFRGLDDFMTWLSYLEQGLLQMCLGKQTWEHPEKGVPLSNDWDHCKNWAWKENAPRKQRQKLDLFASPWWPRDNSYPSKA